MPNSSIARSVKEAWSREGAAGKKVLDLSCGGGATSKMLTSHGFEVVATDYTPPPSIQGIHRVAGVDLNEYLPFRSAAFNGVNLIEVIEHIEHQAQLIREISRVLREGGVMVISTPNILNVLSRLRFLFTGFLGSAILTVTTILSPMPAYLFLVPPKTLIHWASFAPELSATLNIVRCCIIIF